MNWFSRKPRNTRAERDYTLDVKVRSQPLKAMKVRLATLAVGASLAVVFGVFLAWRSGQWAINEFLFTNESFAIEKFDIQTDGVIPTEQLRKWAGVKIGDNLLALDLARVKRDLELVPLIESVAVQRVLPKTLRLMISEREPVAQVHVFESRGPAGLLSPRVFYIDQGGYVMAPLVVAGKAVPQTRDWLPTITGVPGNELRPGWPVESAEVRGALRFISEFEKSPLMEAVEIRFIDASSNNTLMVTTEQGSEITLGLGDFTPQLRRWRGIYDLGTRANKSLASLDLAVANYLPARWIEEAPVPLHPKAKSSKTSPYRKRHV